MTDFNFFTNRLLAVAIFLARLASRHFYGRDEHAEWKSLMLIFMMEGNEIISKGLLVEDVD
jgi:hypothetical protein